MKIFEFSNSQISSTSEKHLRALSHKALFECIQVYDSIVFKQFFRKFFLDPRKKIQYIF
eukprot:UN05246